jgi:hypothetical protein
MKNQKAKKTRHAWDGRDSVTARLALIPNTAKALNKQLCYLNGMGPP